MKKKGAERQHATRSRAARKAAQAERKQGQGPQKPNPGAKPADRERVMIRNPKESPSARPHRRDTDAPPRPSGKGPGLIRVKGVFSKHRDGFGFIRVEAAEFEDVFVPPDHARGMFHGDRVELWFNRATGSVARFEILNRRAKELLVKFIAPSHGMFEIRNQAEKIALKGDIKGAKDGEWLRVKLESEGNRVYGRVEEVYGATIPARADLKIISGEFGWSEDPSPEAIAEAQAYGTEVTPADCQGRKDLTGMPFMTIDGETARDFDDAVHVDKTGPGKFTLWVAIADVSHYVKPGTALDRDAEARSTSVYFPERAFHMLPAALSENLCSLRPNVLRLAMTAKIDFDSRGEPSNVEIFESVIKSRRRATYTEIEAEKSQFPVLFELFGILRAARMKRGAIDFDFPESKILCDENGEPTEIKIQERKDAHRLIEEFMIAANEAVSRWMEERKRPFLFRIHDLPAPRSIDTFTKLAHTCGVDLRFKDDAPTPLEISNFLKSVEGNPNKDLLHMSLLRSLKQAVYSSVNVGHFGLASTAYTHFTSPIRRYPDLVVHRLLRAELRKQAPAREEVLEKIADHCSYRERLADDAERESKKIKQVRYMLRHIGDEFDAKVVGFNAKGVYVRIPDPFVEGFIDRDTLDDDFYVFNEDKMTFSGQRNGRQIRIGDPMRIRVVSASLERRLIDFARASLDTLKRR